jgi:AcrR family transcriptional regulator
MEATTPLDDGDQRDDPPGAGRRSGRRSGFSGTRQDIIRAAQKIFAERGFQGTTMRAIAREAKVDTALIHHFFVSKAGVFSAAIGDEIHSEQMVEAVLGQGLAGGGEVIRSFLALWDSPKSRDPMLAVVRSSVTYDDAASLIGDFVTKQVIGNIVKMADVSHSELRTTLIASQIIGLLMVRYVLKLEPLASATPEVVAKLLGPSIDQYLTGDLDIPGESPG